MLKPIRIQGARQNNLKNLTLEIPARKLTVITGLSGSGKSSLAFDTLYAEGQRRYVESLSTYTRQFLEKMPKPEVDRVENIPPAIALEQKNHIVNSRSTVGTQTEIVDYLRILYARIGHTRCVSCEGEVRKLDAQAVTGWACRWLKGRKALIVAPLAASRDAPAELPPKKTQRAAKVARPVRTRAQTKGSTESVLALLREQGFARALWRKPDGDLEVLDLAELSSQGFPQPPADAHARGELYVVVDRIRLAADADRETRSRLSDSIDQATAVGRGRVGFVDLDTSEVKTIDQRFACLDCGREHRQPEPNLFSFNSPIGACARCSGFGHTLELDEGLVVPDPTKTLKNGAIDPFSKPSLSDWQDDLFRFAERHGISIGKRYRDLKPAERALLWDGDPKDKTFAGVRACFNELKRWKYKLHIRVFIRRYQSQTLCPDCQGARLNAEARAVRVGSRTLPEALALPAIDALAWLRKLELSPAETKIARDALAQVDRRLEYLVGVGVEYLSLARLAKTLSGGEFQRINLATQLGNGLCGTLYVLDEPSIGLHAADTDRLLGVLERLRDQGNTVVVVEHDLEVMRRADWLVELGPGAGRRGGELVASGDAAKLAAAPGSLTGKYLSGAFSAAQRLPRGDSGRSLKIVGCRENNLKDVTAEFPLERFVVVTGVSGSGKSTLVHKTLYNALARIFLGATDSAGRFDRLYGAERLGGIVLLDQTPIGRSSRSNPATYIKAWDEVRRIYANQVISLRRGYTPQHFSFNVGGGRCPVCKGEGEITLDMHFLAEVKLPCEECEGRRFKKTVLEVAYRGKNVHQLLHTTVDEAYELLRDHPTLKRKLNILRDVGLGYLALGQSATTLSGGESQRLKIAATLDDSPGENLLYVFDEPTTGLHLEDVKRLLEVLQDLVDRRHSLLVIEHHLDVIAQADWVIDLGPGGGERGGRLVAAGSPGMLAGNPASVTGRMLREKGYRFPPPPERTLPREPS